VTAPTTPAAAPVPRRRIASVDIVRGLAMVVMVLDHTREFAHAESFRFDPTDLDQTTPAIFFTRWITHFVAPIFVILAGVSARLQLDGGRSRRDLARFLILRGLWLVLLEFTVVRVGIWFNADPAFLGLLQVIWVLGISMIALAGLVYLPDLAVAAFGLALIAGHNALDAVKPAPDLEALWSILHVRDNLAIFSTNQPDVFVLYPLIPWVGVMAVGYVLGRVYGWSAARRRRLLLGLGAATTVAWVAIRVVNEYGDPLPWQSFGDPIRTLLSFLNAEKYPPSLVFLTMTLGPALVLLGLLDGAGQEATGGGAGDGQHGPPGTRPRLALGRRDLAQRRPLAPARRVLAQGRRALAPAGRPLAPAGRWLATLGAVPLFFYLLQWYVAHGLSLVAELVAGQDVAWHFMTPPERFFNVPPDAGFPLPMVYLLWLTAIAILYPVCRWYGVARARRGGILRYL
jgi:uncharacterized membrane protein